MVILDVFPQGLDFVVALQAASHLHHRLSFFLDKRVQQLFTHTPVQRIKRNEKEQGFLQWNA